MNGPRLHLASASPRRRALIDRLKLPFSVGVAPVDEPALEAGYAGPVEGLGEFLARHKALAAARELADYASTQTVVLGADTTVILDGASLGKPHDLVEAEHMLRSLRGRQHTVVTGVALIPGSAEEHNLESAHSPDIMAATVATRVLMRDFTDQEMSAYLATGDSLDKAGAYAVQHGDFQPVAAVEGCYLCVVGLPLCAVSTLLADAGLIVEREGGMPVNQPCNWCASCRPPLPFASEAQRGN